MNVLAYENEKYQEGETSSKKGCIRFHYLLLQVDLTFKILLMLIMEPFIATWYFLFPVKTRNGRKINGQVALVTGSANGLGRAIAFRLAQENCNIAVADINYNDAVRTANEIREKFRVKAEAFKVDVSDVASIKQLKIDIEASLGAVDILVNNAGMLINGSLREYNDDQLQKIINVNFTSHFWTVRIFLDGMIERKRGRIVAISSMSAKLSIPLGIIYSTTKAAVQRFMDCLDEELHCYGHQNFVQLTTVFPGFIATRKELTDILDDVQEFHERLTPNQVANATVKGMLKKQREITVPPSFNLTAKFLKSLPRRVRMIIKTELLSLENLKDQMEELKLKNFPAAGVQDLQSVQVVV